jgi:hypothetical protein
MEGYSLASNCLGLTSLLQLCLKHAQASAIELFEAQLCFGMVS